MTRNSYTDELKTNAQHVYNEYKEAVSNVSADAIATDWTHRLQFVSLYSERYGYLNVNEQSALFACLIALRKNGLISMNKQEPVDAGTPGDGHWFG